MLPKDLTADIKKRLTTIQGQIGGLVNMLNNETDHEKIITQFKAAKSGLETAYQLLLDDVYRKVLALKIVEVAEACPGDCGNEGNINVIKTEFPMFDVNDLTKKLKEITDIEVKMQEYKKKKL